MMQSSIFRRLLGIACALAITLPALPALAQHDHAGHHPAPAAATGAADELAEGEIRRIDAAAGSVLIKHGEIRSIGMGAMTMGFKLKDPALAKGLAAGDKVRFAVEKHGDDYVVTKIEKGDKAHH